MYEGTNDSTVTRSLQVIYNSDYKLIDGMFFNSIFDKGCMQNYHGFTLNVFERRVGGRILIINLHLTAHPKNVGSRRKEVRVLRRYLKILNDKYDIDQTIITGDFNTSWRREIKKIDEILSPYLNRIEYDGFTHQSKNLEPTKFVYKLIRAVGRLGMSVNTQLDHFYVSPDLMDDSEFECKFVVDPICVSDHHPIILTID